MLMRDTKSVCTLQSQLKQLGESTLKLIGLLYTNFKTILLIQSCKSGDICKTTGLQYYQVKYNQDKVGHYTNGELVHALRLLQKIEIGIKQGTMEEQIALDYAIINIL